MRQPFFLAAARHLQGRLVGQMEALGFRLRDEAVLRALTDDVVKSSEIEGEKLDVDQVRSSMARRRSSSACSDSDTLLRPLPDPSPPAEDETRAGQGRSEENPPRKGQIASALQSQTSDDGDETCAALFCSQTRAPRHVS